MLERAKSFAKEHPRLTWGATTAGLCLLSAYRSLYHQDVSGQEYQILIRDLPEELFSSGDMLTLLKSGAIAYSVNKFFKTFPDGKSYQAMWNTLLFEFTLEALQFPRPDRFCDLMDFTYITLGAFAGSSLDCIIDKFKKN